MAMGKFDTDHLGQSVRLALQREPFALDLLVVLELGLASLTISVAWPARRRSRTRSKSSAAKPSRSARRRSDALGGPAVAGHHHAAVELQGPRTGVPWGTPASETASVVRREHRAAGPGSGAEEVHEARDSRRGT